MSETTNRALPLVMLLGDSIRIGYQQVAIRELGGVAEVWVPQENCAHTAHTISRLDAWFEGKSPDVVHINCGLHDMMQLEEGGVRHSKDIYRENLNTIFTRLKEFAPKATRVFALTTPVDQDRQLVSEGYGRIVRYNKDVPEYNLVAKEVAEANGFLIDDLYSAVADVGTNDLIEDDGVHFKPEGYEVLGKAVGECIRGVLGCRTAGN